MNSKTKKWVIIGGVLAVMAFIGSFLPDRTSSVSVPDNDGAIKNIQNKSIGGLQPADIYLNLKSKGFTIKKDFNTEYGNLWSCTKQENGISYNVTLYSHDANTVEELRVTVTCTPPQNAFSAKNFVGYMMTIEYDGSDVSLARDWLIRNYNSDKATNIIGSAKFTISAPTDYVRIVNIEPA